MLVLSRKLNQSIMIGDDVEIIIVSVDREQVKLGIKAPREIAVHRSEVYQEIQRANETAAATVVETLDGATANTAVLRSTPLVKQQSKKDEQMNDAQHDDRQEEV
jgi:carbon storage regulator